jgi:hypothetical protein
MIEIMFEHLILFNVFTSLSWINFVTTYDTSILRYYFDKKVDSMNTKKLQKYLLPSFIFYSNFKYAVFSVNWDFVFCLTSPLGHSNHLTPLQLESLLTEEPTSRFWLVICLHAFHLMLLTYCLSTFTHQQISSCFVICSRRLVACRLQVPIGRDWFTSHCSLARSTQTGSSRPGLLDAVAFCLAPVST